MKANNDEVLMGAEDEDDGELENPNHHLFPPND